MRWLCFWNRKTYDHGVHGEIRSGYSVVHCFALVAVLTAVGCVTTAQDRSAAGKVEYGSFHSACLGGDVTYAVSLPPSYGREPSRRYPVVVFLHGLFNTERDWEKRGIEGRLEALRASGAVGEFIVALPFGANSFYLNGKDGTRYEDAIVKDFIPFVDKTYRTMGDARHRAIQGISMGGFGALTIAFKHPDLFTAVAAHSAAIFEELPSAPASASDQRGSYRYQVASKIFGAPPDRAFFQANNPLDLGVARANQIRALKIYFDVGTGDRYGFAVGNARLHDALDRAKVKHEYQAAPGDHGWSFLVDRSEPAFRFLWSAIQ